MESDKREKQIDFVEARDFISSLLVISSCDFASLLLFYLMIYGCISLKAPRAADTLYQNLFFSRFVYIFAFFVFVISSLKESSRRLKGKQIIFTLMRRWSKNSWKAKDRLVAHFEYASSYALSMKLLQHVICNHEREITSLKQF